MAVTLSSKRLRQLLLGYLVGVAAVVAIYAVRNARALHPWVLGEWLINYSAGPVRRGLLGELVLVASRGLHLPLVGLTLALQLAIYAVFYGGVYRLSAGVRWSLPLVAALVSPATMAFTVLDPPSSVRKEALLFATLAVVLLLLRRAVRSGAGAVRPLMPTGVLLAVVAPVLVLTHEALLCYLPYLFAAPFLLLPQWRTALRLVAVPALLAVIAAALVVGHPGDRAQASRICDSVGASVGTRFSVDDIAGPCGGAIAYLGMSRPAAREETRRAALVYRYDTRYPLPMALALAPAALLLWGRLRRGRAEERRRAWWLIGFAGVALLGSLPLFVYARDWGRWVHLHATCLLLLLLALEWMGRDEGVREDAGALELARERPRRLVAGAALLLYATAWTLPAVGIFPGRFGYLDLLRYVTHYETRHTGARGPGAF